MSTTNPTEGQSENTSSSVKVSESDTSIQTQSGDAEAVPESAAVDSAAAATEEEESAAASGAAAALTEQSQQPPAAAEQAQQAQQSPAAVEPADPAEEAPADAEGEAAADAAAAPAGDTRAEGVAAAPPAAASAAVDAAGKPRATRSRNPAFAAKQKNFIKDYRRSVGSAPVAGEKRGGGGGGGEEAKKRRKSEESVTAAGMAPNDNCCWVCHREGKVVCCETCPRVFHLKCAQLTADPPGDWVCVECRRVVQAETVDNLSPAMKMLTHEQFTLLLKHAIGRLKGLPGAEPFITPVDEAKFPNYGEFVSCPMDLNTMEENINRGQYGSTEAFIADCKWILHNCILFNGQTSKLTALAKSLLRMCKWEMEEIETCPDCYSNAYLSDDWFTLACPHPHMLIWARLKGFPYWPAKAVKSRDGNVDCRFFGRHDRAWVPIKECYLFSKDPPSPPKNRSKSLDACIEELEEHIHNLEEKFGKFVHAKARTVYDPRKISTHIKHMLPSYECNIVRPDQETPKRKRSGSELQLDKLEKLRQQKAARRSGGAAAASLQQPRRQETAQGGKQQPGPGAPGGPPDLQAHLDDELMEPEEDELEEDMEELEEQMEELEAEEPMEEDAPKAAKQAAKPARKSQGKPPVAAAVSSPAVKPAATPAKPAAAAAAKAAPAPAKASTVAAKAAQSSAKPAAGQAAGRATPAAGTKQLAKAAAQAPVTAVNMLQIKGKMVAAPAAVAVRSGKPAAALAGGQTLKMGRSGSPAGVVGTPHSNMLRAQHGRPRLNQPAVRANGFSPMSPAGRPRLVQQQQQQRSPAGFSPARAAAAAAASAAANAATNAADSGFVVSTPSRIGPMMIVPGSGGAVSNGAPAGPAEGATAADAPPPPSHTGAVSEQLRTQANDLSELMRSGLEKAISDLTQSGAPAVALASLRLQLDRLQWRHQMELSEQKKVTDTMLAELRNGMEIEQKKMVNKLTSAFASERGEWSRLTELRVVETKKKQWCATCGREAIFYCCWNTSYCDFPCQEAQWPKHMLTCANQQSGGGQPAAADGAGEQQQQEQDLQQQQEEQQQPQQAS